MTLPLRARKINQLQLAADDVVWRVIAYLGDMQCQNAVTPTTCAVEFVRRHHLVAESLLEEVYGLATVETLECKHILNVDRTVRIDFQL